MAQKIDAGAGLRAHTAIQAMIGRARITANRDGKRVGVLCDLANNQLVIVDLDDGCTDESKCIQIFEPGAVARLVIFREDDSEPAKISLEAEESQYC